MNHTASYTSARQKNCNQLIWLDQFGYSSPEEQGGKADFGPFWRPSGRLSQFFARQT